VTDLNAEQRLQLAGVEARIREQEEWVRDMRALLASTSDSLASLKNGPTAESQRHGIAKIEADHNALTEQVMRTEQDLEGVRQQLHELRGGE
jgi:predicted  nucleic acid-binding Zn-ribbon protein